MGYCSARPLPTMSHEYAECFDECSPGDIAGTATRIHSSSIQITAAAATREGIIDIATQAPSGRRMCRIGPIVEECASVSGICRDMPSKDGVNQSVVAIRVG